MTKPFLKKKDRKGLFSKDLTLLDSLSRPLEFWPSDTKYWKVGWVGLLQQPLLGFQKDINFDMAAAVGKS